MFPSIAHTIPPLANLTRVPTMRFAKLLTGMTATGLTIVSSSASSSSVVNSQTGCNFKSSGTKHVTLLRSMFMVHPGSHSGVWHHRMRFRLAHSQQHCASVCVGSPAVNDNAHNRRIEFVRPRPVCIHAPVDRNHCLRPPCVYGDVKRITDLDREHVIGGRASRCARCAESPPPTSSGCIVAGRRDETAASGIAPGASGR